MATAAFPPARHSPRLIAGEPIGRPWNGCEGKIVIMRPFILIRIEQT